MDGNALDSFATPKSLAPAVAALDADSSAPAECGVLSAILGDVDGSAEALLIVADKMKPSQFEDPRRAAIWAAMLDLRTRGSAVNESTVASELHARREINAVRHIGELRAMRIPPTEAEGNAKRVAEHAYQRKVAAILADAARRARGPGAPLDAVTAAKSILATLPDGVEGTTDESISAGMLELMTGIELAAKAAEQGARVSARWGVDVLDGWVGDDGAPVDGAIGGFYESEVTIIGGVPASGKTTLAVQATIATARGDGMTEGLAVLYFTLEMSRVGLCRRLVAQRAGVPIAKIKQASITHDEMTRLGMASTEFGRLPVEIIETCRTVEAIEARIVAEKARRNANPSLAKVGLVVVDYLQLVRLEQRRDDSVREDQDRVNAFKGIANRARVPVLLITSMTKTGQRNAAAGNVDMTAGMGSGAEYAADVYGFLVRLDPKDTSGFPEVRLELVKVRDGVPTPPLMRFDMARGRFSRAEGSRRGNY